jgi:uncharacterized surface protein with fasciclin (FAS1) repeats
MKKTLFALAASTLLAAGAWAKDIVDTAVAAGSFKTLATALAEAGLVNTLKGPGPFTVFAPTDEAFAKIPKDQLDALLKDKAKLTAVLTYHVVPGRVLAKDVKSGAVKTVQGQSMTRPDLSIDSNWDSFVDGAGSRAGRRPEAQPIP